ncbi:MAG TPA: cytochrome c peroxidase [Candidatus Acidoferrales bacterium]|nr:cytochrome c peroxidase [Candidatus Acidoferrales bacterium]
MSEIKIRSTWRCGAVALLFAGANVLAAQQGVFPADRPPKAGPLSGIPLCTANPGVPCLPLPRNLSDFVVNQKMAAVLGKALFWDQQGGSDGLACGSCHFHAGADNRVKNQIDPGLRNVNPTLQNIFSLMASNKTNKVGPPAGGGPNYTLNKQDFPFHQLADPTDHNSTVVYDSNDVVSSQGVFRADFNNINVVTAGGKGGSKKLEVCNAALSPTFAVNGINTRQVEPRNTPTMINAIFNFRNFWDGRANNTFNGRNPFGPRDTTAGIDPLNSVLVADFLGNLSPMVVSLPDASLASQAVGPPGSNLEMSCSGRLFEQIGQKMLRVQPLFGQPVDPTDSVLGPYSKKQGLNTTYEALIKQAFAPQFWNSTQLSGDGYRQIEKNFSLFWGLSIMVYESTLVSDDTPFDRYTNGDITAMTTQQVRGFEVFNGNGGCVFCHSGPVFSAATTDLHLLNVQGAQIERMQMGDGAVALYDSGHYNIGVRGPGDDIGVGGLDPFGNPLSWTRQVKNDVAPGVNAFTMFNVPFDGFNVATCNFESFPCMPIANDTRDAVDGSFKAPGLRNVELTGPYFHNGGQDTLEHVVDFYNRGGDAAGTFAANTTGFGINPTNRPPSIQPLFLSDADKAALVAFLKALTDDRVRFEKAPFDHPGLTVPNGQTGNELTVKASNGTIYAIDDTLVIPAVGAAGRAAKNLPALGTFDAGLGNPVPAKK